MRATELIPLGYKVYKVRLRIKNTFYTGTVDTTVSARNTAQARALIKAQYGKEGTINSITEVK